MSEPTAIGMIFKQYFMGFKESSFASGSKNESGSTTYWFGDGAQFICVHLYNGSNNLPAWMWCRLSKRMSGRRLAQSLEYMW